MARQPYLYLKLLLRDKLLLDLDAAFEDAAKAESSFNKLVDSFHRAGVQVAVKGIETAEQLVLARKSGADLLQGYHLGHPKFPVKSWDRPGRGGRATAASQKLYGLPVAPERTVERLLAATGN
jgi:EAL domain-containing protein (putative c-di-GMP-specific phosphodiesterase class I)